MADFFQQLVAALAHRPGPVPDPEHRAEASTRSPTASLGSAVPPGHRRLFLLFQTMYDGFVERARLIERTADRCTTFRGGRTSTPPSARRGVLFHRGPAGARTCTQRLCSTRCCLSSRRPGAGTMAEQVCRDSRAIAERVVAEASGH